MTTRVPGTNDDDLAARHLTRVGRRRAVEHPAANETLEWLDAETSIRHAACEDDRVRLCNGTIGEGEPVWRSGLQRLDGARQVEGGAEAGCLKHGAAGKLTSGDAAGEAEVVADHGARACLTAERLGLDHQGRQALGRCVHRSAHPGGAGADHRDVEDGVRHIHDRAERGRDLTVARIREQRGSHHIHERERGRGAGPFEEAPRFRRVRGVDASGRAEPFEQLLNVHTPRPCCVIDHNVDGCDGGGC